jgi:hypothetical protein
MGGAEGARKSGETSGVDKANDKLKSVLRSSGLFMLGWEVLKVERAQVADLGTEYFEAVVRLSEQEQNKFNAHTTNREEVVSNYLTQVRSMLARYTHVPADSIVLDSDAFEMRIPLSINFGQSWAHALIGLLRAL